MQLSSLSLALTAAYGPGFAWRNLFTNNTPGFRINVEEALRLNKTAIGSKTSGFTADELSRCVAFQDSAGTLPVVSMEQPLGLILDTKAGVPVLGPELVTNASIDGLPAGGGVRIYSTGATVVAGRWYVIEADVTDYVGTSSVGFSTSGGVFSSVSAISGNGKIRQYRFTGASGTVNLYTSDTNTANFRNISVRELPGNHFVQPSNTASRPIVSRRVNLLTATATLATQDVTTLAASHVLTLSGTGSVTLSGAATGTYSAGTHTITTTAGTLTVTVSGSVTNADLRLSIDSALPYQRVTSATDYDEAGFPAYARADGLDDWLESGVVDMTSTDAVTVIAGVTKLSDAASAMLLESSVDASLNNGSIRFTAPGSSGSERFNFGSRGTTVSLASTTSATYNAPYKALLTGVGRISTDTAVLRINGVQAATSATDQGTGNYGAHKFYMGRRAGSSLPFNGRIYGVTVVGKLLTDGQLAAAEQAERQLGRLY